MKNKKKIKKNLFKFTHEFELDIEDLPDEIYEWVSNELLNSCNIGLSLAGDYENILYVDIDFLNTFRGESRIFSEMMIQEMKDSNVLEIMLIKYNLLNCIKMIDQHIINKSEDEINIANKRFNEIIQQFENDVKQREEAQIKDKKAWDRLEKKIKGIAGASHIRFWPYNSENEIFR